MNKLTRLMTVVAALGAMTACTDLVTKEVDSKVITTTEGGNDSDPAVALSGNYDNLGNFTDQAGIYSLTEHVTDELIPPTRGVDWSDNGVWRSLYTHTWESSHSYINNAWNQLNQNAYNTQTTMEAIGATPEQIGQAKFLRAFNRYYIVSFWGVLPDRKTSEGPTVNPKIFNRTDGLALVEKDLLDAVATAPVVAAGAVPQPIASKAAANALLSRLYLNKAVFTSANPAGPYTFAPADMAKVIKYAAAVMADGYKLNDSYFDNFKKTGPSTEVILTSPNGTAQNRVFMTLHYNQNPSGWNGFATLADFYGKFDAADKRKGVAAGSVGIPFGVDDKDCTTCPHKFAGIGLGFLAGPQVDDAGLPLQDTRTGVQLNFSADVPLSGAATNKGIRVIKYHPAFYDRYVLIRFAEVYLNMIEAKVRGGVDGSSATSALVDINVLRAKRGAAPLAAGPTLQDVLDERGRELYWEGYRRDDLIRFGKFNDDWSEKGPNKDAYRVLYVIPQQAVDSNPNLKQNPGYGGN